MNREDLNELRPELGRVLHKFGIPPSDAENILQDSQLALLVHWDKILNPKSWLIDKVTKNCIEYRRRQDKNLLLPTFVNPSGVSSVIGLSKESTTQEALHKAHDSRPALWKQTLGFFDTISLFIPDRIADEDLGDAIEDIHRRLYAGQHPWRIYCKMASTAFWIAINSLREIIGALGGKAKANSKH
jgi:hypothetical protein